MKEYAHELAWMLESVYEIIKYDVISLGNNHSISFTSATSGIDYFSECGKTGILKQFLDCYKVEVKDLINNPIKYYDIIHYIKTKAEFNNIIHVLEYFIKNKDIIEKSNIHGEKFLHIVDK